MLEFYRKGEKMKKICIVGGGAAAMACAIMIKSDRPELELVLIEKNRQLGRKLSATGNGKCNITNVNAVNFKQSMEFLKKAGIDISIAENGWCYPRSKEASAVVSMLEKNLKLLGIQVITGEEVNQISICDKAENRFVVDTESNKIYCSDVVVATGGKAAPHFGTVGDGYRFAKQLGHNTTRLAPGLTGIEVEMDDDIFGKRCDAAVSLFKKKKFIAKEEGQIQFTDYGVSGICIMNLSSYINISKDCKFSDYELEIDFLPDLCQKEIADIITGKIRNLNISVFFAMLTLVKRAVIPVIMEKVLNYENIDEIANTIKHFRLKVIGTRGWNVAQVTRGGIRREEIDENTMMSHIHKGLYFIGEIVDFDAPCGGFNLDNAWGTAVKAANSICIK